jgi:methylmalonyl-CoA mutase cobalamin-binding subunit
MNDATLGFKVALGNGLLPVMNDQLLESEALITSFQEQGYWYTVLHQHAIRAAADASNDVVVVDSATQSYTAWAKSVETAAKANGDAVAPTVDETEAIKEQSAALDATNKALTTHNDQTLSVIGSLQTSWESYNSAYQEVANDMWLSDEERKTQLASLSATYELETNKIILAMTAQVLASDGLTTKEMAYLLEAGKSYGIYSDSVVAAGKKAIDEIDALNRHLNDLPQGRTFTFTIAQQGSLEAFYSTANMGGRGASGRATGGAVTEGTPYIVGERGQELCVPNQSGTIVPNNKLSGAGGANININIVTPALIGSDGAARDALLPILRAGVRQLQSEGLLPL